MGRGVVMLTFVGSVLRVIIGFVVACFAAALVQVAFALTPAEMISASSARWSEAGVLLVGTATITMIFAASFAAISALISEWQGIRNFAYHALVGVGIAMAGHALLYSGQNSAEPSIVNSYAAAAYLTAGLAGGTIYWAFAGRWAHRPKSKESGATDKASA